MLRYGVLNVTQRRRNVDAWGKILFCEIYQRSEKLFRVWTATRCV